MIKASFSQVKNKLNRFMADAMAVATVTTPLMACCEKLAGFESGDSRSARMTALMLIAAGYGTAINAGRDLAERIFKPKNKGTFNQMYYGAVGGLSLPVIYLPVNFIRKNILEYHTPENWSTALAVGCAIGIGYAGGKLLNGSKEIYHDLMNVKGAKKVIHPTLENQSRNFKRGCAIGLFGLSILATETMYHTADFIRDRLYQDHSAQYVLPQRIESQQNSNFSLEDRLD